MFLWRWKRMWLTICIRCSRGDCGVCSGATSICKQRCSHKDETAVEPVSLPRPPSAESKHAAIHRGRGAALRCVLLSTRAPRRHPLVLVHWWAYGPPLSVRYNPSKDCRGKRSKTKQSRVSRTIEEEGPRDSGLGARTRCRWWDGERRRVKDWFEGIRDTATPDRLRPAGNRTGRKKKLFWAGMSGDGEKNNWFGTETSPNLRFLCVSTLPTSLNPDRWVQREGYGGPNLDKKSFQLFWIFIV